MSCQAKERDFWPKEISKAVGVSTGISTHNNPKKYIIKSPEETVAGQSASPPASRSDKQEVIIEGSRGPGPFVIEYVTWGDVWSHASQTIVHAIHCSMTNVLYQGGRLSLVKAGGSFCQQWSDCMLNASDAVNEWCRAKIPWPQCTLSRRSALRWSIDYQGVSWPNALTKAQPPLELDLTAY